MTNIEEHEDHAFEVLDELLSRASWKEGQVSYIRAVDTTLSNQTRSKYTFYDVPTFTEALSAVASEAVQTGFKDRALFDPKDVVDNILAEYSNGLRRARLATTR